MDGEFVCEDTVALTREAVGGGNLLLLGRVRAAALRAAEAVADAVAATPGAIAPFPGGVVRSGSKIGSKYKGLPASTNHAYCPTLRGVVESVLDERTVAVLEVVIDGLTAADVAAAMRAGLAAAVALGPSSRARTASAPATTAASSDGIIFICRSWRDGRPALDAAAHRRRSGWICSALLPQSLAGQTAAAIERLPIGTTRAKLLVGDIFRVKPGSDAALVIEGGSERFDHVGQGHGQAARCCWRATPASAPGAA